MISAVHLYTDLTAVCQTAALVVRPSPARPPVLELRQCAHRIRNTHPIASLGGALAGRAAAAGAPARAPAQHTHMHAAPHVSAPSPPRVPPGTESLAIQSPHPRPRHAPRDAATAGAPGQPSAHLGLTARRYVGHGAPRAIASRRAAAANFAHRVAYVRRPRRQRCGGGGGGPARARRGCTYGMGARAGPRREERATRGEGGTTRAVAVAGWACQCCSAPAAATRGRARQRGYRKEMGCAVLQKGTESVESFNAGR